jgi:hypothetical protein
MNGLSSTLRQQWRSSSSFRWLTILALAGLVINLVLTVLWQMEIISFEDSPPANDLKTYLEAGSRFLHRENLYVAPRADFGLYAYSPAFAGLLGFLTFLPYKLVWVVDALLHIIIYWAIYWRWFTIFRQQRLNTAAEILIRLFPLWIIFTGLLYEIAYMNIYIFMAFTATLLLEAMLFQQTGKAILWLTVLLPIKPQWAFALGIPFLFGQWRFLVKVAGGALLAYFAILAGMILITGQYALQQYREYFQFLQSVPYTFVWNTMMKDGHIGYNNSIMQLVIFFTNRAPYSMLLTTVIKIFLSLPLIGMYWRYRHDPSKEEISAFTLEWAFALYLLAFLWLDVVTELTFGIVIFPYLLGTLPKPGLKILAKLVFLPYALTHIWITVTGIASFIVSLPNVIIDPSLFIPFILIAMLGLYALVLWQLKDKLSKQTAKSVA